jgi:hypothetical protein
MWALSFMKSDRAARFVDRHMRNYQSVGSLPYSTWQEFVMEFVAEFCPKKRYIVASNPSSNSFERSVSIQTTDTGEVRSMRALLDSGATGMFVNRDFVKQNRLTTRTLSRPIPVYNMDGLPNKSGSITEVEVVLRYRDHSKWAVFAVTNLGRQDIILGLTWLREHNPKVDWKTEEVKMSRCPNRFWLLCRDLYRKPFLFTLFNLFAWRNFNCEFCCLLKQLG